MDLKDIERIVRLDERFGPCEDDCEKTAPYIDILPEETDSEDPSPLNFKDGNVKTIVNVKSEDDDFMCLRNRFYVLR